MKIVVYVDGFNLYYGAVKNTPYKWLDIGKMCGLLFPKHEIKKIKYFTALVRAREGDSDLDKPVRQQIYLRALKTTSNLEIFKGFFNTHKVRMKLVNGTGMAEVFKTEKKGTDVSLASHLINDGHNGEYELAVVISNDSDLVEPIRIVIEELKLPVVIANPYENNSLRLKKCASSVRHIRKDALANSQFPEIMSDMNGEFKKPSIW